MGIFNKAGDEKREKGDSIRNLTRNVLYILKELLIDIFYMILGFFWAACIMRFFYMLNFWGM